MQIMYLRFVRFSQFIIECEWQREESQTIPLAVPHVLSFGEWKPTADQLSFLSLQ